MITDEQIKSVFLRHGFKLSNEAGDDLKPYVYAAARELVAIAQEVEPLKFEEDTHGDFVCCTTYGEYQISPPHFSNEPFLLTTANGTEMTFSSREYSEEIANDTHKAIITKNLKYGGKND